MKWALFWWVLFSTILACVASYGVNVMFGVGHALFAAALAAILAPHVFLFLALGLESK